MLCRWHSVLFISGTKWDKHVNKTLDTEIGWPPLLLFNYAFIIIENTWLNDAENLKQDLSWKNITEMLWFI